MKRWFFVGGSFLVLLGLTAWIVAFLRATQPTWVPWEQKLTLEQAQRFQGSFKVNFPGPYSLVVQIDGPPFSLTHRPTSPGASLPKALPCEMDLTISGPTTIHQRVQEMTPAYYTQGSQAYMLALFNLDKSGTYNFEMRLRQMNAIPVESAVFRIRYTSFIRDGRLMWEALARIFCAMVGILGVILIGVGCLIHQRDRREQPAKL